MVDQKISSSLFNLSGISAAVLGASLDSFGTAIVITDADLDRPGPIIRFVNARFEHMTGYSAEELVGRSPRLLQGPETDRETLAEVRQQLDSVHHFQGRAVNYRKSGQQYVFEWIIDPIKRGDRVIYWIALQRDVTFEEFSFRRLRPSCSTAAVI